MEIVVFAVHSPWQFVMVYSIQRGRPLRDDAVNPLPLPNFSFLVINKDPEQGSNFTEIAWVVNKWKVSLTPVS